MKTAEEYANLAESALSSAVTSMDPDKWLSEAQVYATLAQVAATLEEKHGQYCHCFKCYKLARDGG